MERVALGIGLALIALGVGAYVASGAPTSLIPAYVGAVLGLLGVVVMARPGARKHAMHVGAMVGMLGFLAAGVQLARAVVKGGASSLKLVSFTGMTVLCGLFVILAVRSFIAARKAREAGR